MSLNSQIPDWSFSSNVPQMLPDDSSSCASILAPNPEKGCLAQPEANKEQSFSN